MRYCARPGCPVIVEHGYCPAHRVGQEHARPNWTVRTWYRTPRWRALRAQVLAHCPLCPDCVAAGVPPQRTTDVDHRVPHGGDPARFWDPGNLQAKCHGCHSRKTRREQHGAGRIP